MNEETLVAALRSLLGEPSGRLRVGIGDDAAVWSPRKSQLQLITVDEVTEDVDFRRTTTSLEDAGWRALAVSLSDVAAMGGRPIIAVISLTIPSDLEQAEILALYRGMAQLAARHGVQIAGGDLSRGAALSLGVTVVGEVRRSNLKRRRGGAAGNVLAVTGPLGLSRAGLAILEGEVDQTLLDPRLVERAVAAYRRPQPRVEAGRFLGGSAYVTAMMDLSDGLAADLPRLAAASGVAAIVDAQAMPIDPACRAVAEAMGISPQRLALEGGDELELLCAVRPRSFAYLAGRMGKRLRRPLLRVGRLEEGAGVVIEDDGERRPLDVAGWDVLRR